MIGYKVWLVLTVFDLVAGGIEIADPVPDWVALDRVMARCEADAPVQQARTHAIMKAQKFYDGKKVTDRMLTRVEVFCALLPEGWEPPSGERFDEL